MKTLKIEAGKFYRTRDGKKAGIYRTNVNHDEHKVHGYVIASDGVEYSRFWHVDGRFLSTKDDTDDLIEEWQGPLDFDWGVLPPWCNGYIKMDEDGAWYAYSNEPILGYWDFHNHKATGMFIPEEYQPKNFTGDWKDSLFKNPNL